MVWLSWLCYPAAEFLETASYITRVEGEPFKVGKCW
jgi:hypothetical protein